MFVLKQLRRKKRINQTDLGLAVGVSLRTIQLYEKKNANIPIKNLTKIANYFDVTIAELYSNEVNEIEGIYQTNQKLVEKGRSTVKKINNDAYLVSAPLVPVELQDTYFGEYENKEFLEKLTPIGFVIQELEGGNYLSFEVKGNAMLDGSSESIPDGAIVLGIEVSLEDKIKVTELKNSVAVVLYENSILCKEIIAYDEKRNVITCHSLNSSPEYADFEIALDEVNQLFKVVKKQMGA